MKKSKIKTKTKKMAHKTRLLHENKITVTFLTEFLLFYSEKIIFLTFSNLAFEISEQSSKNYYVKVLWYYIDKMIKTRKNQYYVKLNS